MSLGLITELELKVHCIGFQPFAIGKASLLVLLVGLGGL